MACGMEAEHDFGAGRLFQAQALGADGYAAIAADLEGGAHAPDIRPPGARWHWAHHRTVFLPGLVPGPVRGLAQFAMDFAGVVVGPQLVDVGIGDVDFRIFSLAK